MTLELGGKSPVFVFPDADIDAAIKGAASAIFLNSGQVCSAGSRLYVHERVFDQVVEGIAAIGDGMKLGHGMEEGTALGPLISAPQRDRVAGYVESGLSEGARIAGAARQPQSEGYFVAPTVLVDTNPQMRVVREEIFGPVLVAQRFSGEDDLTRLAATANDTEYGLFAGIWSADIGQALRLARRIRAGSVSVNAHMVNEPALPLSLIHI